MLVCKAMAPKKRVSGDGRPSQAKKQKSANELEVPSDARAQPHVVFYEKWLQNVISKHGGLDLYLTSVLSNKDSWHVVPNAAAKTPCLSCHENHDAWHDIKHEICINRDTPPQRVGQCSGVLQLHREGVPTRCRGVATSVSNLRQDMTYYMINYICPILETRTYAHAGALMGKGSFIMRPWHFSPRRDMGLRGFMEPVNYLVMWPCSCVINHACHVSQSMCF